MLNEPEAILRMYDECRDISQLFVDRTAPHRYTYNFTWLGLPVIQYPQDLVAMQELIWSIRPDVVIEAGVAHGGSLIFYASMLEMLGGNGIVIGVDIDIRRHNRELIETHPLAHRVRLIEGSSVEESVVVQVQGLVGNRKAVVVLDSDHTHDHVLAELRAYSPMVGIGSYMVVMDTVVDDMPEGAFPNRLWGRGNNPKTAVHAFLAENHRFEIDAVLPAKLLISVAPDGYLRCIRDP